MAVREDFQWPPSGSLTCPPSRASEPPEIRRARRSLADARDRLDHLMAGLEAGLDPKLAVGRIRHAQTEVAVAEAIIARHDRDNPDPLTEETVRSFLRELGGLQGLLAEAEPGERRRTYEAAGVALRYRREDDGREALVAGLRVGFSRVGGASCPVSTWATLRGEVALRAA